MIAIPITIGPIADRADLDTAIACLLSRAPSHLALHEPEWTAAGWVATGIYYARDRRERAQDDQAAVQLIARVLRKYDRLPRQRRPPSEED